MNLYGLWPEVRAWCASMWGYRWRKRLAAKGENVPPGYRHVIDSPFGRSDWNNRYRLARYITEGW